MVVYPQFEVVVDLVIIYGTSVTIIYGYFPNGANSYEGGCSGHCQKGGLMALIFTLLLTVIIIWVVL